MGSFSHNNRTCIVCKIAYKYCNNCPEFSNLDPWHAIFHDSNCRSIFNTAFDFDNGKISKDEAFARFNQCDLSNKENFSDSIKKSINKAFTKKKEKNVKEKSVLDFLTESVDESDNNVQEEIKSTSRKRGA